MGTSFSGTNHELNSTVPGATNNHTHRACLSCGSTALKPLGQEYAHAFLVKCASCGLVFCSRVPTSGELQEHYGHYRRGNSISEITRKRYRELLERFEPYRKLNRILDIGCGDGYFLEEAKKKGWEVYGTEFTDEAIAVCREKGIHMHQGILQEFNPGVQFDVITSFEVLEHINDGNEHLAKIGALLRNGGLFYFTTPNFNSLSRVILGGKWNVIEYPEHLVYYTFSSVNKILLKAGFRKMEMHTTGFSRKRFQKSKGRQDAEDADENLRQRIEKKSHLRLAKSIANGMLDLFSRGDTLKGFYRKP